jgi:hypothetical protein
MAIETQPELPLVSSTGARILQWPGTPREPREHTRPAFDAMPVQRVVHLDDRQIQHRARMLAHLRQQAQTQLR